jgi:RecA-family ATPase
VQAVGAKVRVLALPNLPGKGDVLDWAKTGGTVERLHDLIEHEAKPWTAAERETKAPNTWCFYTGEAPPPPRWLIKGILPETGVALIAGQWGTYKTTVALDFAISIMAATAFAQRYRIKRQGAVLYVALEGEGMLAARLNAVATHRNVGGALPFAWRGDCPALTDNDAAEALCTLTDQAAAELKRQFDLPLALVVIDTMVTAAQYEEGGDNDAASAQSVMNALRTLSQHTGALVIGVDHFGKVVETGTRGSSAKEGAADTVIALLADRELSGSVMNTRR